MKPSRTKKLPIFSYIVLWCIVSLAWMSRAQAEPMQLLPRPQQAHYGKGSLPVTGLEIRFETPPTEEDRFAADQLAAGLSSKAQTAVEVRDIGNGPAVFLKRTGEGATLPGTNEIVGPNSRESYSLKVTKRGAEITAPSSAGLFYGVQTLLQMVEGTGADAKLPIAEIRDWPALAYRGFMMDFSHGQLLRIPEIKRQIDLLARYKANQYFFYSECNIEMEGYELVNADARYSRAEVRDIIDYARQRHMDVVPCIEMYGHMHDLFRVEKFKDLGLPLYGEEFDPRNPHMLAMMDDWLDQMTKLFASPWIHVGFDEPWSLGKIGTTPGKDPFQGFVDTLAHLTEQSAKHGRRLMFWADINNGASTISNHPELIAKLPGGATAVPWDYEIETNYEKFIEPLSKLHIPTFVAPAVWNWNEIFPDYHKSFYNLNGLTAAGKKLGTLGMLNTGWTDCGQTLYRQSLPGLAFGAAAAWQTSMVDTNTFFNDYCKLEYPEAAAAEIAPALEELSQVEEMFESILNNATQHGFWRDPLASTNYTARLEKHSADLHKARLLAEDAQEHLMRAQRMAPQDPTLKSLLIAARLFDYLGMKCLYAVEWTHYFRDLQANPDPKLVTLYIGIQMNAQYHSMMADLMDTITELREPYREAWLEEYLPYRLATAMAKWDEEQDHWTKTWHKLNHLLGSRKKDEPFPSIEAIKVE